MKAIALILMAVSLDLKDASLSEALKQVEEASGLRLAYSQGLLANADLITLKADNQPVDEVLHRILRPNGLEFIYTGEKVAAIVRSDSNMGMAKAAGRALRTLWRLERKLEVVGPDGLPAPGWSDADDIRLALAAVDLGTSIAWFGMLKAEYLDSRRHQPLPTAWELVHPMHIAFDPDVRAGAIVPSKVLENAMSFDTEDAERARASLLALLEDPDPLVRACAFRAVPWTVSRYYSNERTTVLRDALQSASVDPAPEVRLAASLMCRSLYGIDESRKVLGALRGDDCAAVRLVAWLLWLDGVPLGARPDVQQEITDALFAHRNPVVRAAAAVALSFASYRGPFMVEGLFAATDPNDSIIRRALSVCRPKADAEWLNVMLELLTSDKRFDQALGVAGLAASSFKRSFRGEAIQRLALVLRLGETDTLLGRTVGTVTHAVMRTPDAEALLLESLRSTDELDRVLGLLSCALARSEFSAEVKAALRSRLASRAFSEQLLAAWAVRETFPFAEYLPLVKDAVERAPNSSLADLLLLPLCTPAETLLGKNTELADQLRVRLLDIVLSSDDAKFQMRILRRSREYLGHEALLLHVVKKASASVLAGTLTDERFGSVTWRCRNAEGAARMLLERLEPLLRSNDPAERNAALAGMRTCLEIPRSKRVPADCTRKALDLLGEMIEASMADGAAPEQFARGLEHLAVAVGVETWADLPESIRRLSLQSLLLVNDAEYHVQAVNILRALWLATDSVRWEENAAIMRKDAGLMTALAQARRKVMKEGTAEDQAIVLFGEAWTERHKFAPAAKTELEQLLVNGEDPPTELGGPHSLLGEFRDHPTHDVKQYMLEQLRDRQEMLAVRRRAAYYLDKVHPEAAGELMDIAAELAEGDPDDVQIAINLVHVPRRWLERHKDDPRPPWVVKGIGVAAALLRKPGLFGMKDGFANMMVGSSTDKCKTLQALVLDPTFDWDARRWAASRLGKLETAALDFRPFVEHYDDLPFTVRRMIAQVVGKNGAAPGAAEFAMRFIKDPETRYDDISYIVHSRSLPNTPELRNARKGARMGLSVTETIKRLISRLKRVSELVR